MEIYIRSMEDFKKKTWFKIKFSENTALASFYLIMKVQ